MGQWLAEELDIHHRAAVPLPSGPSLVTPELRELVEEQHPVVRECWRMYLEPDATRVPDGSVWP